MRVALDTNGCYTTQAGVARYIRGLIQGFLEASVSGLDLLELAWKVENLDYRQPQRAIRTVYREAIWMKFIAPMILRRQAVDLLHSTVGYGVRPTGRTKCVATVHDLAVLRYPERFRKWQGWSGRRQVAAAAKADRVICISRFTADECIRLLGFRPNRIEVIYNGCDFHPNAPIPSEERPDFTVPAEFFLFVGSLEPGKNLRLLKAVYQLASEQSKTLPPLVIVGARWEGVGNEGRPPQDWHYAGRQPDEALVYLYRRALALVFPSKYEGFGLPIVEGMALGCPVICSPVASLPEVGGTAPLFVEMNPLNYLQAMQRLVGDSSLRKEMIAQGRSQALRFSWKRCAEECASTYADVLRG